MFFLVDAFAEIPFCGNPAGVYFLDEYPQNDKLQALARYYNFPDLAFLKRISNNTFYIKWFAPLNESPLCGHATLASSHIIFENNLVNSDTINFKYNNGTLSSKLNKDKTITMSFPIKQIQECQDFPFSVKTIFGTDKYVNVLKDDLLYIVVLNEADAVKNIIPAIEEIKKIDARAIVATARGDYPFDFTSRYFSPRIGVMEDPVCASMHCRLTWFWAKELGKTDLMAFQASKRTGILKLKLEANHAKITGKAVTVSRFKI
ncbi:isomerase [Alphaproteobacteria bacterium]|nr:isomerase [Alphaproteobacteria bacterium]